MPSKKQRRRRQKDRRHEYEYVYVDDEGQEIEADEVEDERPAKGADRNAPSAGRTQSRGGRAARKIEPPSWRRVGRRAVFLAPVLVLLMYLLPHKGVSNAGVVLQAMIFLLIFLPFSYMMDTVMYRSYLKRTGQAPPPRRGTKEPKAKA